MSSLVIKHYIILKDLIFQNYKKKDPVICRKFNLVTENCETKFSFQHIDAYFSRSLCHDSRRTARSSFAKVTACTSRANSTTTLSRTRMVCSGTCLASLPKTSFSSPSSRVQPTEISLCHIYHLLLSQCKKKCFSYLFFLFFVVFVIVVKNLEENKH